jgi:2-haloacid dehalogenase
MIKAIGFDYDGVIEIGDGDIAQKIAAYLKITKDEWHKIYYTLNYLTNVDNKSWAEVAVLVAKKFNASDTQISDIQNIIKEYKKVNLELIETIKDLKNKNYKIGLLSNNTTELRQKLIDQNIFNLFDVIIISAEVSYQKPQPEIFKMLANKLGVSTNEMIFIDDSAKSLEGAKNIGYMPILFSTNKQLNKDLLGLL